MKPTFIAILTIISAPVFSQVFVGNGGQFTTMAGSVVMVQDMDFVNTGNVDHAGELEVHGNIENDFDWKCDLVTNSITRLTLDWTNNHYFESGTGLVEFFGGNQSIQGSNKSYFYDLKLLGASGIVKSQKSHAGAKHSLNLTSTELATNGYGFTLGDANIPVQRNTGYISTFLDGYVRAIYPIGSLKNTEIPVGYGIGPSKYKPFYLIQSAKDSFDVTLYGNSAGLDGKDILSVDDSVCKVNPVYYYRHITFGSNSHYGFTRSPSENIYTKIGWWNGSKWEKIGISGRGTELAFDNLSHQSQLNGNTKYITHVSETPFVTTSSGFELEKLESRQIFSTGYFPERTRIGWSPNKDLSCSNCLDPVFTMGDPGILKITADNGSGCVAWDTLEIWTGPTYGIFIPSAFTPNGNNLNEGFGPVIGPKDRIVVLQIYNRWGEKLFDNHTFWDGNYQGEPVMEGVYVYKVMVERNLGAGNVKKFYLEGTLTLLR